MSDQPTDDELRSFTAWKLDLLNAISFDPIVRDNDFRVAFRLIQGMNWETRETFTSYDVIAGQIGVSRDKVMRSAKKLRKIGWLKSHRENRAKPYHHSFVEARMNAVIDAQIIRVEAAREAMNDRWSKSLEVANLPPRNEVEVADRAGFEVANRPNSKLQDCNRNTFKETPSPKKGSEGSESSVYESDYRRMSNGE